MADLFEIRKVDSSCSELLSGLSVQTFLEAYEGVHSQEDLEAYCSANYAEDAVKSQLKD